MPESPSDPATSSPSPGPSPSGAEPVAEEVEPDYRFTLANERTVLAWLRTSLGLFAAAVALVQLVPEFGFASARHVVGGLLGLLGVTLAVGSLVHWQRVQRAMRRQEPLPVNRMPVVLGGVLVVVGIAVTVLLVTAW